MPKKNTNILLHSLLVIIILFTVSNTSILAEEPEKKAQTSIQIYYSGAQSGYLEPCG
jgi:hypothetical protein